MTARISSARLVTHGSLALLALSALLAFLLLTSSTAHGATFLVNSTADEDDSNPGDGVCEGAVMAANCSLRAAVQEANALAGDDLIALPAGTYTLTIGQLTVSGADELTIAGPDASVTVIDGNGGPRVFLVVESVVAGVTNLHLSGVTITNGDIGAGEGGGGILSQGAVILIDSIVDGNLAGRGAGIYNAGGRLTLIDTSVSSNTASGEGGGIYNDAGALIIKAASFRETSPPSVAASGPAATRTSRSARLAPTYPAAPSGPAASPTRGSWR